MDVYEKDVRVNEDLGVNEKKTTNRDDKVNEIGNFSKYISFHEIMRGLSLHHLPLKDRLKDKTVPYIDLFRPGPPPSRKDDNTSKGMAKRK